MYQLKTINKKEMDPNGAYPVFGANGVLGRYGHFNREEPKLVVGCRGACGSIHATEPFSWITGNTMVIQPKPGVVTSVSWRSFFRPRRPSQRSNVRFTLAPLARSERAAAVRTSELGGYEDEMRRFLDYVLTAYEVHGVDELAPAKIADFLRVRYGGIRDAKRGLGSVAEIKQAFVGIQRHLYGSAGPTA